MSLVRENWRERWSHVRDVWIRWDPLGLAGTARANDYEAFVGPTLSMLAKQRTLEDFEEFLAIATIDQMGLADSDAATDSRQAVARELYDWFANLPRP